MQEVYLEQGYYLALVVALSLIFAWSDADSGFLGFLKNGLLADSDKDKDSLDSAK